MKPERFMTPRDPLVLYNSWHTLGPLPIPKIDVF